MNIYLPYCTYITFYSGHKLPPFYIGSSSIIKVINGYNGSVSSIKYKKIWQQELKDAPHLFKTIILTNHEHRKDATEREYQFQVAVSSSSNPMYINEAYAKRGFAYGKKQTQEHVSKRTSHRKGIKTGPNLAMRGENHPNFGKPGPFTGKHHSVESNEKNRDSHLGKIDSLKTKQKKSGSAKGKPKPWLRGISPTQEIIKKQNESRQKDRETWSEEKKQQKSDKISAAHKGKKKTYLTNCGRKFICRLRDRKELSKASASLVMSELKQYF
jgi:hypothetical protein